MQKEKSIPVQGSMWSDLKSLTEEDQPGLVGGSLGIFSRESRDSWAQCRFRWCRPQSCRSGSWSSSWWSKARSVLFGFGQRKARGEGCKKIQQTGNCELRVVYCNSKIPKNAKHRSRSYVGPWKARCWGRTDVQDVHQDFVAESQGWKKKMLRCREIVSIVLIKRILCTTLTKRLT